MADAPKDNRLPATETCALYYFPEIPSGMENDCRSPSRPERFVSGSFSRPDNDVAPEAESKDAQQTQLLIEEAFNKGLEQGRAEIMASQQEKINNATTAFEACVKEMLSIRQRDIEQMETETVRLALAITKKIIGQEVEHGAAIHQVVKTAMEKVNDPRQLVIRLNPGDIDAVKEMKHELLPKDDFGATLRIEADEAIQRGGCIVETQLGDVDARIDRQVEIIEALLIDQLPKKTV